MTYARARLWGRSPRSRGRRDAPAGARATQRLKYSMNVGANRFAASRLLIPASRSSLTRRSSSVDLARSTRPFQHYCTGTLLALEAALPSEGLTIAPAGSASVPDAFWT